MCWKKYFLVFNIEARRYVYMLKGAAMYHFFFCPWHHTLHQAVDSKFQFLILLKSPMPGLTFFNSYCNFRCHVCHLYYLYSFFVLKFFLCVFFVSFFVCITETEDYLHATKRCSGFFFVLTPSMASRCRGRFQIPLPKSLLHITDAMLPSFSIFILFLCWNMLFSCLLLGLEDFCMLHMEMR